MGHIAALLMNVSNFQRCFKMVVAFLLAAFLIGYTLSQSNPPTPDAETHNQKDIQDVEAKSKEQANIPHYVDPQPAASLANISNGLATQNANLQKERDAAAIAKIQQGKQVLDSATLKGEQLEKHLLAVEKGEEVPTIAEKELMEEHVEFEKMLALRPPEVPLIAENQALGRKRWQACQEQKMASLLNQGNVPKPVTNPTWGRQHHLRVIGATIPTTVVELKPPLRESLNAITPKAQKTAQSEVAKLVALAKQKLLEEEATHEELNAGLESRQTPKVANHTTWATA